MVSALDSGASAPGSSPGWGHCVDCVLGQDTYFTLTVPLSTQVYKCVSANLMLGVTLRWTYHIMELSYNCYNKNRQCADNVGP